VKLGYGTSHIKSDGCTPLKTIRITAPAGCCYYTEPVENANSYSPKCLPYDPLRTGDFIVVVDVEVVSDDDKVWYELVRPAGGNWVRKDDLYAKPTVPVVGEEKETAEPAEEPAKPPRENTGTPIPNDVPKTPAKPTQIPPSPETEQPVETKPEVDTDSPFVTEIPSTWGTDFSFRRRLTAEEILSRRRRRPTSAEVVLGRLLEEVKSLQ